MRRHMLHVLTAAFGPSRHLMRRSAMSAIWGNPEVAGACSKRRD
jgi:hypothetical protein